MIFGERSVVRPEKNFTSTDLYRYVEKLLKEASHYSKYEKTTNYSWLKSREINDLSVEPYLEDLRPLILKMTSENAASVAVKLDILTEENQITLSGLLTLVKKLLLEQDSISLMEQNVKGAKEMKTKKIQKVHPELVGRQATVSFIVESDML